MSENEFLKRSLVDMSKFMLSAISLFVILGHCFEIVNYCLIDQKPLENYIRNNLKLIHFGLIIGLFLWANIKERQLALKTALIFIGSLFMGWRLYYFSIDGLFVSHTIFMRVVCTLVFIAIGLIIASFTLFKHKAKTIYYLTFIVITVLLSYLNYLGTLAYFVPSTDYNYISSFLCASYVSMCACLVYVFEVILPEMYKHIE